MDAAEPESPIDLERLLSFLGYGNPRADVVFIGMEEGLSASPPLREQLVKRSKFTQLMDLRESADVHADRFFTGANPPIQSTWNVMMRILLAREKPGAETTLDDLRRYQRAKLGRSNGPSALLELMPLPAPGIGDWPYEDIPEVASRFPSRDDYYRSNLRTERIDALRSHLSYGPSLVVCYGSGDWPSFKKIFEGVDAWTLDGEFAVANLGSSRIVLTPHFVARQMNGQRERLISICTS